jgi:hypothetical protein
MQVAGTARRKTSKGFTGAFSANHYCFRSVLQNMTPHDSVPIGVSYHPGHEPARSRYTYADCHHATSARSHPCGKPRIKPIRPNQMPAAAS